MSEEAHPAIHDVLIIGAGPCGLAVAARLCEHTPSALFTDVEHNRYHWIKKHGARTAIKSRKSGAIRPSSGSACRNYSTLVLDGSGEEWMSQWNRLFETFEIEHLRSPTFFHPDPLDRDGLLAFTYERGRGAELVEICGCVGKEVSKHKKKKRINCRHQRFVLLFAHQSATEELKVDVPSRTKAPVTIDERDRKDYFTPSRSLFRDYCDCVIDRYRLRNGLVKQEVVKDIDYGPVLGSTSEDLFSVRTDKGVQFAKTVVLAVGAGNAPSVPKPFRHGIAAGACHAMRIRDFPDPSVKAKMEIGRTTNVVVIGGGLTSAQVADMAIRHGVTKVWHLMRGPLKVKPFDVDLSWMGKFQNHEKASFWSADTDEERLVQIKEARGGGSLTPKFAKILKQHIGKGRLSLHTHTTVVSPSYCPDSQSWKLVTDPPIANLPEVDYVYFATGIQSDFSTISMLRTMVTKYPIPSHGGLPALNDDLMWKNGIPLFMTGRLASLRLGPGAGNLEGARIGAERISWAIEDILGQGRRDSLVDHDLDDEGSHGYRYGAGVGSRFESLVGS